MRKFVVFLKGLLCLFGMLTYSNLALAEKVETSKVTIISTDKQIPETVQNLWHNGFEECTEKGIDTSDSLNGFKIQFSSDRSAGGALYIIACGGPGYNRPYVAIAHDAGQNLLQRVAFSTVSDQEISADYVVYNPVWNNKKMTLSIFAKDRGLADCGQKAIYKWARAKLDSGFVLIRQFDKSDCDGSEDGFSQTWPRQN